MSRSSFRTFDDAFAWLTAHTNYETMLAQSYDERTYGLDRVRALLADVGRPDEAFDAVQVVGSKGKGSTAAMIAGILRASGRTTGLFSSPHLVDARERIAVDGRPAPDDLVCDALSTLRAHVERAVARGAPCTFFEIQTAAALLAFRAAGCEAAVLEAGMGGRLDATTAARVRGVALTGVSLDHTQHLGRTRRAVAAEKAAAARRAVPLFCGEPPGSAAFGEIEAVCRRVGAPLTARGREFRVTRVRTALDVERGEAETSCRLTLEGSEPLTLRTPLLGEHQARNAALAAVTALRSRWSAEPPTPDEVRAGLAATRIPARLQVLGRRPLLLVDGAHSPASMSRLAAALRTVLPGRRFVFVVGMARDKDLPGSLRRLAGLPGEVVATTTGGTRAATPDEVAAAARRAGFRASTARDPRAALRAARRAAQSADVIVVTGSLYLCGAVLAARGRESS